MLGNGTTSAWNIPYICDSADFIEVAYTDADGVQTALSSSVYTLTLNPPAVGSLWGIGANLVYPISGSPIASGTSLTVSRILPLIQTVTIANQGDFAPQVIEEALDTLEMQLQQVSARTGQIRGVWTSGTDYNYGDVVQDGANGANSDNYYMCAIANTSDVWADDLADGDWSLAIQGAIPAAALPLVVASGGTGSTTAAGARTNLGLGTMAVQNASAVAITGGTISADYFQPLGSSAPTNGMYLPAANTLGFSGDSELSFKVGANPFGTTANRNLTIYPGASGSAGVPYIASEGTGTAIAIGYSTKSTGTTRDSHYFYAGDELILSIFGTQVAATMDRNVVIEPGFSSTSQFPSIRGYTTATPGSGNSPFGILSEGTGYIGFHTRGGNPGAGGSDVLQCQVTDTASAVNYWSITGAATGNAPNIQLSGSNTNIGGILSSKGTGSWGFYTRTSQPQLFITDTASSVNYWTMSGSATGNALTLGVHASSTDTNVSITLSPKGSGTVNGPSFTPSSSTAPTNGMYLSAANTVSLAANSTLAGSFTSTGLNSTVIGATTPLAATFTTSTANSFIPNSATVPTNGLYLAAANNPAIAANSAKVLSVTLSGSGGNHIQTTAAAAGGISTIGTNGADATGNLGVVNVGSASMYFYTGFTVLQAEIAHTASADRRIIFSGSNGGNPSISTSAGNIAASKAIVFDTAANGIVLKRGSNGKTGTFTLTGATPVTVNNTGVATSDIICISLGIVGGTVGVQPNVRTLTAATSFTVAGTSGDVSVYNYAILSNAV